MSLEILRREIESCRRCELYLRRKNPVVGEGPVPSEIMLVGEAPGYYEDLEGRPFVGRAGRELDKLLELAGLDRGEVYITNVVKCRPPNNREPRPQEIEACIGYLLREMDIIKPHIIVTLGNIALQNIFNIYKIEVESIGRIHGKIFIRRTLRGTLQIIPMYHPATILYKPPLRAVIEEDWRSLGKYLREIL